MDQNVYACLKQVELFSRLPDPALQNLVSHFATKSYGKNTILINEGDETGSLHVIISGKVRVFVSNECGKEFTLDFQGPGHCFGELALLDGAARTATVVTTTHCSCGVISRSAFKEWLASCPEASFEVIRYLVHLVRTSTEKLKDLAISDVYKRLTKIMFELAVDVNGVPVIEKRPTQQNLANRVGSSREMISRIFKDLAVGGYISVEGKRITINKKLPDAW